MTEERRLSKMYLKVDRSEIKTKKEKKEKKKGKRGKKGKKGK